MCAKKKPQNHTEVMRPELKPHSSVQKPTQCIARVLRDVVPAQCKPHRIHASKDASHRHRKTIGNKNILRV